MSIRSSHGKLAGALAGAFAVFAGYGGLNIDPGANAEAWMVGNEEVIRFTQSGQLTVIGSGMVELLIVGGGGHDSKGTDGLGGGGSGGYDGGSGVVIIRYRSVPPGAAVIIR